MLSKNKIEEREEELINDLDAYIDCLKDITDNFSQTENVSVKMRTDVRLYIKNWFFNDYINLEDNILSTFEKIKYLENERINLLINKFNQYWTDYQDTWSEEYWAHYEELMRSRDKTFGIGGVVNSGNNNGINNYLRMSNIDVSSSENNFINNKSNNTMRNSNMNLLNDLRNGKKEETLNKIDEELKNIEKNELKEDEKKRGCIDCVIF